LKLNTFSIKYFDSIYFVIGEIGIFEEEEDIKIITLPPTPYKNYKKEVPIDCGISTQILPLSRLSLSSSNTSTPPHSSSSSPQESSSSSSNKNKNSATLAANPFNNPWNKLCKINFDKN